MQETKWIEEKAKKVGKTIYKLWYTRKYRNKNWVGIVVDKSLKDEVIDAKRAGDRMILIKLVLGLEFVVIVSVNSPQAELDDATKQHF